MLLKRMVSRLARAVPRDFRILSNLQGQNWFKAELS